MVEEIIPQIPTAASASAGSDHGRREVLVRRGGIVVLALVVLAGGLGYLGPHSRTASDTGPAGTVEMEYDAITRPGVDTESRVTLRPERAADCESACGLKRTMVSAALPHG